MVKISHKHYFNKTEVYFDGILHLVLTDKSIHFLQSWIEETGMAKYRIELIFNTGATTELHYEDRKVWEEIIKILSK